MQAAAYTHAMDVSEIMLWPSNPTPVVEADADTDSVELGVKFSSSVAVTVTGVRFYKGVTNTGTHTGSLWTAGGSLLAQATFTGETASGWQSAYFGSPVLIEAGTYYVASYFAPNGHYAVDDSYFAGNSVVSGVLSAPDNATEPNGVYAYSATSTFPDSSFSGANYWVDVIATGIIDNTPPSVPTGLGGVATGVRVDLSWSASTDNIGVSHYEIYRDGSPIDTSQNTTYQDVTTSPSTTFTYAVRAVDFNSNASALTTGFDVTTGLNSDPTASFSSSPSGLTVYVDASGSSDVDGSIATYDWDWGDGANGSGVNSSHTYASDDIYTITLTVTDNLGATDIATDDVDVSAAGFIANAINNPSSAGYPDETNTGVPTGTTLTPSGSITVNTDGAIIEDLDINGQIVVNANNVTIRRVRLTSGDFYPIAYNGPTGLLVEDCEIIATSYNVTAGISFANYTARRVFVTGSADGFKANENVLIEDCYVDGLGIGPDTHNDGVQATGGSNVTIRHNTFKLGDEPGVSAVIQLGNEWSSNSDWLIEDNLIDGGGWSINASSDPADNPNAQVLNNRFTRRAGYGAGYIGGAVWTGNYYDDDGTPV